jgi:hypothetical protein
LEKKGQVMRFHLQPHLLEKKGQVMRFCHFHLQPFQLHVRAKFVQFIEGEQYKFIFKLLRA